MMTLISPTSRIFVAGHRGMLGRANCRALQAAVHSSPILGWIQVELIEWQSGPIRKLGIFSFEGSYRQSPYQCDGERMGKTALIAGVTGRVGTYLAHHLLGLGYRAIGTGCDAQMCDTSRLQRAGVVESSGNDFDKPTLDLGYVEAKE